LNLFHISNFMLRICYNSTRLSLVERTLVKNFQKISNLFKKTWFECLLVFIVAILFSRWFWPELTFGDPDTFYHLKLIELLDKGIVREFPWLPFTSLGDFFIDHHFLYHVLAYPFVKLLGSFVGIKIFTQIIFALGATFLYFLLKQIKAIWTEIWVLFLIISPTFVFRMHLAKAPGLSVIIVLLGIFFLIKKRYKLLGLLSALFVWAHGAWLVLPLIISIWVFARVAFKTFIDNVLKEKSIARLWDSFKKKEHFYPLAAVVVGCFAGMVINPYFPNNFLFLWFHNIQIGILSAGGEISVGAEWYVSSFKSILGYNGPFFLTFIFAISLFLFNAYRLRNAGSIIKKEESADVFAMLSVALVFFVLLVRSRRHIDFFMPLAIIATSMLVTFSADSIKPFFKAIFLQLSQVLKWLIALPVVVIIFSLIFYQGGILYKHRAALADGYSPRYLEGASKWIQKNAPKDAIVFHSDWDDFPFLLYHNDEARYIIGLDATLLYVHDKERYKTWLKIIKGEFADDVVLVIKEKFGAQYVLLDNDHEILGRQLDINPKSKQVYKDFESVVFEIKN